VLLVEASDRVLPAFPESLSARAAHALERLGVTPLLGHTVVDVSADSVSIQPPSGEVERVEARTAVWAAGVTASELATTLADGAELEVDRAGRVPVAADLTLPGHPEVFALGDMVSVRAENGDTLSLPGLAPVAMQQGRFAARAIRRRLADRPTGSFRYVDKGNLATIGRSQAVADIKGIQLSGFVAWVTWLVVHIAYLTGLENRYLVLVRWTISFFSRGRGARLIVHAGVPAGEPAGGRRNGPADPA
jgi:NADH dehydrogenase